MKSYTAGRNREREKDGQKQYEKFITSYTYHGMTQKGASVKKPNRVGMSCGNNKQPMYRNNELLTTYQTALV